MLVGTVFLLSILGGSSPAQLSADAALDALFGSLAGMGGTDPAGGADPSQHGADVDGSVDVTTGGGWSAQYSWHGTLAGRARLHHLWGTVVHEAAGAVRLGAQDQPDVDALLARCNERGGGSNGGGGAEGCVVPAGALLSTPTLRQRIIDTVCGMHQIAVPTCHAETETTDDCAASPGWCPAEIVGSELHVDRAGDVLLPRFVRTCADLCAPLAPASDLGFTLSPRPGTAQCRLCRGHPRLQQLLQLPLSPG